MVLVRWDRERAVGLVDPLAVDELAGSVLVVHGVTAADDAALAWLRRAPCVTVGIVPAGASAPGAPDVVLPDHPGCQAELDALAEVVERQLRATRVLVDVLRAAEGLDVGSALTVESLGYSTLLAGPDFGAWRRNRPPSSARRFVAPPVRVEREGGELRLTLARPENRNAFSAAMRDALVEALTLAELDPSISAVVLAGAGPSFCSGGDLTEFGTAADVVTAHDVRTRRSVGAVLARLAPAVTALVHGACVGAGIELPAFASRVVADPGATFRLPEIAMGLIPGAGGTVSLSRRIGRQATARLALLGEAIDAEDALALGLVDRIEPVEPPEA